MPVVLVFHGWYANGRAFQSWFKMEDHVDDAAIVAYPDADGAMWDINGSKDLVFVERMIDSLAADYCVDRARVLGFGFSYGGKFVHHLGCKRPELVKAISVGDGSWNDRAPACKRMPVLVTHRTRDDDERVAWGKDAAQRWAVVNGCSARTRQTDAAHGCFAYEDCGAPGSVTFCEDTFFDAAWPHDWNHTVREEYRDLTFKWFLGLR